MAGRAATFRDRIVHIQKATIQIMGYFCGNRAIAEMNAIKISDFVEHNMHWIEYKPSGISKTTRVDAEFKVTEKCSSFIVGRKNCDLIRFCASHRSSDAPNLFVLEAFE